jgi:hypothetical protein
MESRETLTPGVASCMKDLAPFTITFLSGSDELFGLPDGVLVLRDENPSTAPMNQMAWQAADPCLQGLTPDARDHGWRRKP